MKSTNQVLLRPVQSSPMIPPSASGGLTQFLKALNPFGFISNTIGDILCYKAEVKRLELEAKRISIEAGLAMATIDASLHYAMAQLEQKRVAIRGYLALATKQLEGSIADRQAIIRSMDNLNALIGNPKAPAEDRKQALASLPELSRLLIESGNNGSATFKQLTRATCTALESVPTVKQLMPFGHSTTEEE